MKIRQPAVVIVAVGSALAVAMLLHGRAAQAQAVPGVVRAEAFELVDTRGKVRAQLNVAPDGEVIFRLRDERGTIRAKFGADEDGSGLLLLDAATDPGLHVLATRARTSLTLQRGARRRVLRP